MSTTQKDQSKPVTYQIQNWLAISVVSLSIAAVSFLSGLAIANTQEPSERKETTQMVLLAVLPLLGSWVGTVLAYYFSKENLEAATRSVSELSKQLTVREVLASVPVKDKMIKKSAIFFKRLPENKLKLKDLLQELEQVDKGWRIPILTEEDYPKLMLHRSIIDRYLAKKALNIQPPLNLDALTLQNLLDEEPKLKETAETSFGTVREDATLAEVKDVMDHTPNCQDVFVTASGTKTDAVIGWITDGIIRDNAKL